LLITMPRLIRWPGYALSIALAIPLADRRPRFMCRRSALTSCGVHPLLLLFAIVLAAIPPALTQFKVGASLQAFSESGT
jgi:hypothetical protein